MRLESFRLLRYGPFEDLALTLNAGPGCLNLVCAPNGAGKSVLRQAFSDLLFGIGGQSPMGFRHGYQGMRLAAVAIAEDGTRHAFGRRKGHGNTWTDADGNPLATPEAAAHFARTDARTLERLFALDTARLRDGGRALLEEEGEIGQALVSASGFSNVRGLQEQLRQQADSLAPQRKSAGRPFYVALDSFSAARRAASAALLRFEDWDRLVRQKDEAAARLAVHRARAADAAAAAARLQRIRRVRGTLAAHDEAAAWLAAHPEAPDLQADLAPRLAEARHRWDVTCQQARAEGERHQNLLAAHQAIAVDEKLLAEAAGIEILAEQAGAIEQALSDIPKREAELDQLHARIVTSLRQLGSALPVERAASLLPPRAAESQVRALIGRHEARVEALRKAEDEVGSLASETAAREQALALLPAPTDTALLARLRDEIRGQGDPAALHEAAQAAIASGAAALASALAAVPSWCGDVAALAALPPLPAATYERAHKALADAEARLARAADALRAAGDRALQAAQDSAVLREGGEIPDRAAIDGARRHRDELFEMIARLAFGGVMPTQAEILERTGGLPLGLAHEQAVARADRLADRRADESGLVSDAATADRVAREAKAALGAAASAHETAGRAFADALAAWRAMLPSGLPPDARLDDVRAFLAARDRVLERQAALATETARATRQAGQHAAWAAALAEALGVPPATLPALLALASQRLEAASRAEKERTSLEASLLELRRRGTALEAARGRAAEALATWQSGWDAALAALGRPPGEAPAVTGDVLQLLDDLGRDVTKEGDIAARLAEMRQAVARFDADARALAARLEAKLPDSGDRRATLAVVRAERDRLTEQRQRDARRRDYTQQAEQAAETLAGLVRARENRAADLQALVAACGAADVDAAERQLALAAARAANVAAVAQAHRRLVAEGDGLTLDQLRVEAAELSPDRLLPALDAASAEASAAQEAAQQEAVTVALLAADMERRGSDTAYGEAIAAQNAAAATADRVLREALVARLAAALLSHAMEAVGAAGGDDMLARIGGWFTTLTGGAYRKLATEPGPDERQLLVAVPADRPDELKRVDQLSEGTRDQLYLALRLEAVAAHPDRLPFVADDILQTFDDTRAEAALRALLGLSERVQVIVLTHHRHILEIARRLPEGQVHECGLG
ncbi:MAG: AAA family ATPase [Rhodospirillales bacterium]